MDVELGFLPHLCRVSSMRELLDAGVKAEHFGDTDIGEMVTAAHSYFVKSDLNKTITRDMLESDYPAFFSRRPWPEEEYVLTVLIERLLTTYQRAQTKTIITEMAEEVMEDPEKAIREGVNQLVHIQISTAHGRVERYGDHYLDRLREYHDRIVEESEVVRFHGFPIGWPEVSDHTYGLKRREIAVVVARIQVGKSWALAKIALEAARAGHRVYFASLENLKDMTMMRLDCLASGVSYEAYERGFLKRDDLHRLEEAKDEIDSFGDRLIVDAPSMRTDRTVYELYSRAKSYGADMFVGDQLSWVRSAGRFENRSAEMTETIEEATDLTKEMNIASVWAAQFNREVPKRANDARGGLENISLSDTIGQIVDLAFALGGNQDTIRQRKRVLDIIKFRRGPVASWLMDWKLSGETTIAVKQRLGDSGEVDESGKEVVNARRRQ